MGYTTTGYTHPTYLRWVQYTTPYTHPLPQVGTQTRVCTHSLPQVGGYTTPYTHPLTSGGWVHNTVHHTLYLRWVGTLHRTHTLWTCRWAYTTPYTHCSTSGGLDGTLHLTHTLYLRWVGTLHRTHHASDLEVGGYTTTQYTHPLRTLRWVGTQ